MEKVTLTRISRAVFNNLTDDQRSRLKSIHLMPTDQDAVLTIRVFMHPKPSSKVEPVIINAEELNGKQR